MIRAGQVTNTGDLDAVRHSDRSSAPSSIESPFLPGDT